MNSELSTRRGSRATFALIGWLALATSTAACGRGQSEVERAAQSAQIDSLLQQVNRLGSEVEALKAAAAQAQPQAPTPAITGQFANTLSNAFELVCPQPWLIHTPLGATLWNCRAPAPTPDGVYPQCSVVFQPHSAIESKEYYEFALNASPQLYEVENIADVREAINGADAFKATFDADPKPGPLKLTGAMLPRGEIVYVITCSAPKAAFPSYQGAFRTIIDSFKFK